MSLAFALTLIFGAIATIRRRVIIYVVIALTFTTLAVDIVGEFSTHNFAVVDTALKLGCLSMLVPVTLRQTLRPGSITVYRVIGGIAGYLLIGYTWTFAYQLFLQQSPDAIYWVAAGPRRKPAN